MILRDLARRLRHASWGRNTCGWCGFGWRHQPYCPYSGRIHGTGRYQRL